MMTHEQTRDLYERLISEYGEQNQILKSIEEMSELMQELVRFLVEERLASTRIPDLNQRMIRIREEIADVIIMAEQLRYMFGSLDVDAWKEMKLARTKERLELDLTERNRDET